jgi:hypothetical protein
MDPMMMGMGPGGPMGMMNPMMMGGRGMMGRGRGEINARQGINC